MDTYVKAGLVLAGAVAVIATSVAAPPPGGPPTRLAKAKATAPDHCYDFENLELGRKYHVGEQVQARNGVIRLMDYTINGQPSGASDEAKAATVSNSEIARHERPELRTYLIKPRVELDQPARRVTMNIAENRGGAAPHNNFAVNGEFHEISESMAVADGWIVGRSPFARARVNVALQESDEGNWNYGTLELVAMNGRIRTFALGGVQTFIDNVCFYYN